MTGIQGAVFSLEFVYALTAGVLWVFGARTFLDRSNPRRITTGIFWLTLGLIFGFGGVMPHWLTGTLVLAMVVVDGFGGVRSGRKEEDGREEQLRQAKRLGDRIFVPVLMIPVVTFGFALVFLWRGMDVNVGALVGLGFGGVIAMVVGLWMTGGTVSTMFEAGRRINDSMGSVNILPQLLAALGVIFTAAGVGRLIADGILAVVPEGSLFLLVLANCLGMALFTIVMGNSFAAFPVIATGVLVPLIVQPYGVNPAMVAIMTLTAGSTGTLMTPMAANFNIVPTALLNMKDQYGVIKFQLPFALTIWTIHVLLMWALIRVM